MTPGDTLLLAIVQGLTEFLPVSSDGHLALVQEWIRRTTGRSLANPLGFDVLLHLGTLAAVALYFRADLLRLARECWRGAGPAGSTFEARREVALMALALVPTGAIGLLLRPTVHRLMLSPRAVALGIGVTGLVLLASRPFVLAAPRRPEPSRITALQAICVGAAQGLAVLPGVSRSGLTIATGLATGMGAAGAFRFSFLLSIPAVAGALLVETAFAADPLAGSGWLAAFGALVSGLVGWMALGLLAAFLRSARFHHFAWYCLAVGVLGLTFLPA